MGLAEFAASIGLKGVQHAYAMNDVHSSSGIVLAKPKLIVPTRH
jgi:hypothetical protein